MSKWFNGFATRVSLAAGDYRAFLAAFAVVLAWVVGGFFVGFGDTTYQLAINSGTTIITFLMVFLIQHTQNISDAALHLKLDEIILHLQETPNEAIGIEHADPERIAQMEREMQEVIKTEESQLEGV